MNILNKNINQNSFSVATALSVLRAVSVQKVITVAALLLLLIAVQVSTQSAGDWFVLGLNVLEMAEPVNLLVSDISNVSMHLSEQLDAIFANGLGHLSEIIWQQLNAFIDCTFG
ncbi:hypothetical protein [Shewanella sp. GutDb-MelDb]|uniref:hypothetical protein n=1 Tax=Shewanella sp. GutDb-MelDb TaxID=2058316 RepID=UPI000C7D4D18|nr:hypothetical protein [Shewanella sp. GutDb-MelDb]PKG57015.1 hypothetical protein CXF82_11845 [Shewanella sp. GutDb-MelDb]